MVLLIDTNVIIDYLLVREPYFFESSEIMRMCATEKIEGYMAFHSVPNLWYILRRESEETRRKWLLELCGFIRVTSASHKEVISAIENVDFKDFEDCLQDRCAKAVDADYIITRNVQDYKGSSVVAVTPEDFLKSQKIY